ncbi:MAG: cysteine synthase family protein [Clostridiales Family XIII bacterium]|jgi:cysteine synthase B|nr:cysteine synthase family protein [Clostridiales Family XIII bacterium]
MRILDMVGNTPLIELANMAKAFPGVTVLGKAEFANPSGSVKDRAAKAMLLDGIEKGLLTKGKTVADATSGNTGIAYAMIGAALGYRVSLYMPANTSMERKRMIRYLGAEIVETSPLESSDGAFRAVREALAREPGRYFYPDQYNNPANPGAHYETTGREIWEQTGRSVTHFAASMGTSGTFTGAARRLKEENPNVRAIAVQPDSPFHGIEGTKHMASTIRPGILDESLQDDVVYVTTEEAYETTRRLALQEGIFAGISSGANVAAALKIAGAAPAGSVIVTILCDSGARYLSDRFWDPPQTEGIFDWNI